MAPHLNSLLARVLCLGVCWLCPVGMAAAEPDGGQSEFTAPTEGTDTEQSGRRENTPGHLNNRGVRGHVRDTKVTGAGIVICSQVGV